MTLRENQIKVVIPISPQQNKIVVKRFDALVDGGDLEQLDQLCTPDMVNHASAPLVRGLDGTREFLATAGRKLRSDRWQDLVVVAEHDRVVQHRLRWAAGQEESSSACRYPRVPVPGRSSSFIASSTDASPSAGRSGMILA